MQKSEEFPRGWSTHRSATAKERPARGWGALGGAGGGGGSSSNRSMKAPKSALMTLLNRRATRRIPATLKPTRTHRLAAADAIAGGVSSLLPTPPHPSPSRESRKSSAGERDDGQEDNTGEGGGKAAREYLRFVSPPSLRQEGPKSNCQLLGPLPRGPGRADVDIGPFPFSAHYPRQGQAMTSINSTYLKYIH